MVHCLLVAVVLIALPVRLYVSLRAELISRDGAVFIWYAQGLQRDALGELRSQKHHPLYPAMVLASHEVLERIGAALPVVPADPVRRWVAAAVSVTLIGGLAVVVAVYVLGRLLFDARTGLVAALLAAVAAEFCQLSGDALTDMPHLAVYLFGLAAAIRGIRGVKPGWLAAAGALAGVAYLIRPEGAEVAVVAAAGVLCAGRPTALRRRLAGAVVVCLAATAIASPYMVITGKLVPKKPLTQLLWGPAAPRQDQESPSVDTPLSPEALKDGVPWPVAEAAAPAGGQERFCGAAPPERLKEYHATSAALSGLPGALGRAWARIAENWARSLRVTLLLPALLWLAARRKRPCEPVAGRLVAAAIVLHLAILTCLILHFDYWGLFSLRHVLVLAALTLPFSAAGVGVMLDAVPASRRRVAMAAMAAGLIAPTLPWMLETRHRDALHIRRAGEWIRRQDAGVPRVMTTRHRAAFYANGQPVWCPFEPDAAWILTEARQRRPGWLVFEEGRDPRETAALLERLADLVVPGERLERVHETTGQGRGARRAFILRYAPP